MAEVVIENKEQLEAWLKDKPREWSQVIALRCALRVFPLLERFDFGDNQICKEELTKNLLRIFVILYNHVGSDRFYKKKINAVILVNLADSAASMGYHVSTSISNALETLISESYLIHSMRAVIYGESSLNGLYAEFLEFYWFNIQHDCNNFLIYDNSNKVLNQALWYENSKWPYRFTDQFIVFLKKYNVHFDVWREWYQRRANGKLNAFDRFDSNADEKFYSTLAEQTDEWWNRSSSVVNRDIKQFVKSLRWKVESTQPDPQTANAPNFGYGPTGRIGVDALAGNKELARDAGAQSRFNKLRQRLTNLVAALKGNNNAGMLAEIADDILYALGSAIEDADPYSAVLDIESLRSALDIQQAYGENDDYRPLEGEQLRLAKNTIAAANLWVGSEEFLERIDATLPGPDHKRPLPERDDAIALADALQSDDLTEPSADKIIRKSAENIPETTDGEDRKTGLMVRGGLNLLRWSINAIVEHESEVLAFAAGGASMGLITTSIIATGGSVLSVAGLAFLLAKNIQNNEDIWRKWAQTARVTESNFDALMEKIRNIPLN